MNPIVLTRLLNLPLITFVGATCFADSRVVFNRDVRPILSENCFFCHGPDVENQEAGLRLDIEGEADLDEVVARVTSDDPDTRMPPPDSERSLSATQIKTLQNWVTQGGTYQSHWSFIPPSRPAIPKVSEPDQQTLTPIDHFIWRRLDEQQLTPAPMASPATLIRRATFDLIGLPPTIAELDEFLADQSPAAYSKLLDRLLLRPEFGERMAADWLDAARYSDTYGFQVDRDRFVWPWRDWVIGAFNENKPYNQFITEQLAGDLLPSATRDQILATTFNRLHPQEAEGGSVPEEFRIESIADRAQTVATALMGLTYECCRCHNHKYDPISQEEYFQFTAFFDNIAEAGLYSYFTEESVPTPTLELPTVEQEARLAKLQTAVHAAEENLAAVIDVRQAKWGDQHERTEFQIAESIFSLDFEDSPTGGNRVVDGVDGKAFRLTGDDFVPTTVGNFKRSQPFSVSLWIKTPDVKDRAVIFHRSRAWTDAASRGYELLVEDGRLKWSLIHFWPGNAISIKTKAAVPADTWTHVAVTNDGSSRAGGLRIFVNGRPAQTDIVVDALTKNITGGGGDEIAIGQRFRDRGFTGGSVDRFRVFDVELTELEIKVDRSLAGNEQAGFGAASRLKSHLLARHDDKVAQARDALLSIRLAKCEVQDAIQEIMVMRELDQPRPSHILARGEYSQPGKVVSPGTPAALFPFPSDAPENRLGLARWLCDRRHPLTARVAVNRYWQMLFGTGLVRTPEDFGSQGSPPTHPELLDHLAVEYIDGGWDTKAMLKQIMMSRTYRQDSFNPDKSVLNRDPSNLYLATFPSYRLPAEMLRDAALAIGDRLVCTIGGPPAKPYEVEASYKPVDRDKDDGLYRRSIYTYWKRTAPAPVMMTLDASMRDVCRVSRERTASPLQAFVMLNGPQYVEAARGLAERLLRKHDGEEMFSEAIGKGFRTLTSRQAGDDELNVLVELFRVQHDYFSGDSVRTEAFLKIGDAPTDQQLDAVDLATMTVVIGTLMNYDESMVKR